MSDPTNETARVRGGPESRNVSSEQRELYPRDGGAQDEPRRAPPLYAVTDRRHDGKIRIVAEFTDAKNALAHAKLLRWAGSPAEVMLISAIAGDDA